MPAQIFLCLYLLYSSFDEYTAEVKSGRLEWSPVHKSEKFWVSDYIYVTHTVNTAVVTGEQHSSSPQNNIKYGFN